MKNTKQTGRGDLLDLMEIVAGMEVNPVTKTRYMIALIQAMRDGVYTKAEGRAP